MKVVLVHDYLKEYGGAERVLEVLHEIWPHSTIYTLIYAPGYLGPHQKRVERWDVRPLIPRWIPFINKLISPLRLLAPILFKKLNLSDYDLVIVSATGAYSPNWVKTKPGTHFCYCHTPPRYLYGLPTAREWKKHWWIRIPAEIANHFLRLVDFRSAQRVDYFIANSKNTARRIEKFYRRKAEVIYPPVDLSDTSDPPAGEAEVSQTQAHLQGEGKHLVKAHLGGEPEAMRTSEVGKYFLAGGRLARPKRIDLAIKACNQLKLPLKVFGRVFAGYGEELKKMAGPTVEFLGEVTEKEKAGLFANCKAFIFPAEEEDFGIVPVEAMSYGKPVIALRQGGVVESVIGPVMAKRLTGQGPTGIFFNKPTVGSLVAKLQSFKVSKFKSEDCRRQAKKFSKERFKREMRGFVKGKCQG